MEWSERVFFVVVSTRSAGFSALGSRTEALGAHFAELLEPDLVLDVAQIVDRLDVSLRRGDLERAALDHDV